MSNPQRFVIRVALFLLLVLIVVAIVHDAVLGAFMHNPALNGLILGVLLLGIAYALRRIWLLRPEIRWMESFRAAGPGFSLAHPPRLLAPVAGVLGEQERRGRPSLDAVSVRYLLDSISARLDESRDITRYQTGLLIFLGLLGTFWGLLQMITAVGTVIADLSIEGEDMIDMFDTLKVGLAAPLGGMGTAFSTSLFGLAGSLVLGFIDLQATQAQNNFYNDLEEWLSGLTRFAPEEVATTLLPAQREQLPVIAAAPLPAYVQGLVQQTSENVDRLRHVIERSEAARHDLTATLGRMNEHLAALGDHLERERKTLHRLVEQQNQGLQQILDRGGLVDAATREHLRQIDLQLGRLIEEAAHGREEMTRELLAEIKMVSRTIAIAAGDPQAIGQ